MNKIALFLLVMGILVSAVNSERLSINVVDSKGRPVEGASVIFSCITCEYGQQSVLLGCLDMYTNKTMKQTNSEGISVPSSANGRVLCEHYDTDTYAYVSYQGLKTTSNGIWSAADNSMTVRLPDLFDLSVSVMDQDGNPIPHVNVKGISNTNARIPLEGETGKDGAVEFLQIPKNSEYLLTFGNGDEEKTENVVVGSNDANVVVGMNTYSLTALVVDENGAPLSGVVVNITGAGFNANGLSSSEGKALFQRLQPAAYHLKIDFQGHKAESDVTVSADSTENFPLDIRGPNITDVKVGSGSSKEPIYVIATINDPSGIKSVTVLYSVNGIDWSSAPVTMTSDGAYRGTVPAQAKDTLLSYKIEAEDNRGNKSDEEGKYAAGDNICAIGFILPLLLIAVFCRQKR